MTDIAEYQHQYCLDHRDQKAEYDRQYRIDNHDRIRERNRQYRIDNHDRIRERNRQYRGAHLEEIHEQQRNYSYANGAQPMSENRSCPTFLGVHIAEQMLSRLFKDVIRMPHCNPGYDFRCAKDYLVDVKSSCGGTSRHGTINWNFHINHNTIADFFLCMAFDDREHLNPLHLWLIPGNVVSHLTGARISENTIDKWSKYEKPIGEAIVCCDVMKADRKRHKVPQL